MHAFVNRTRTYLILIIAALAISCKSTGDKPEGPQPGGWITVTGIAAIQNGNLGLAKDEALKDAKRLAVQEVLGSMVSARTDVKNFQLVSQKVTSKSEGMIETFEILSASAVSDAEYHVKIKAKVSEAMINDTIAEVIASQEFSVGGEWPEQPYRVMALGALYFTGLGLFAIISEIWGALARKKKGARDS